MKKIISSLGLILLLSMIIGNTYSMASDTGTDATATTEEGTTTEEAGVPVVDMNQKIDLTIDLEDDSRFMGVSVYLIGEYDGEKFVYSDSLAGLVDKDYYLIEKEADKYADAEKFVEYIEESKALSPIADVNVAKGIGFVKDLPIGLFLINQNDGDFNSKLMTPFLVEAPSFSEDTDEYLYDLKIFPKWERTVWFSFRPEVVFPVEIVAILIICALLALFGAKLYRALFGLAAFLGFGLAGMLVAMKFISDYLWLMTLFVVVAFLGVGLLWGLYSITLKPFISAKAKSAVNSQLFWITPLVALIVAAIVVKFYVSDNIIYWLAIPSAVAVVGGIIQFIGRKNVRVFYTYEDLLDYKREDEAAEEQEDESAEEA